MPAEFPIPDRQWQPHWMFCDKFGKNYHSVIDSKIGESSTIDTFLNVIAKLADNKQFADPRVNGLMQFFFDGVAEGLPPVLETPQVDEMETWIEGDKRLGAFVILLPYNFANQYKKDPIDQEAQLVFNAGLAYQWFWGRMNADTDLNEVDSAIVFESAYLQTAKYRYGAVLNEQLENTARLLIPGLVTAPLPVYNAKPFPKINR